MAPASSPAPADEVVGEKQFHLLDLVEHLQLRSSVEDRRNEEARYKTFEISKAASSSRLVLEKDAKTNRSFSCVEMISERIWLIDKTPDPEM